LIYFGLETGSNRGRATEAVQGEPKYRVDPNRAPYWADFFVSFHHRPAIGSHR
jgi:hypothetical protein